ncbi:S10 family peptidase [Sphingomonas carotinifaciens]|uniref:S10 family peptidase n=1 Tax=Sphingomonas carotinifaciens TaxID=1166323 RepID=UPI00122CE4D7|nr:peptidase S10 [Sphingomonas carotinifaciens]MBB4087592.1 carboxypeptidase C (cathepsin A) [Sphingomonas carotinifaciens]
MALVAMIGTTQAQAQVPPSVAPEGQDAARGGGGPPLPPSATVWRMDPAKDRAPIVPRRFVRDRVGVFAGTRLKYTVTAADTLLKDALGRPTGSIFSFSYVARPRAGFDRPVIFIFNGGPGSSSLWLHMGVLGPRKIAFRDVSPSQVPPYRLVDNPDSALAVADLVFVDPIGTGFSRYWGGGKPSDFYGREEDAKATVDFIQDWLRVNHRWNSPKFLIGESYGTTRAALVANRLFGGVFGGTLRGIAINGVIMIGGNGGLATPQGNDAYLTTFTTMAATAWYHGRVNAAGRSFDQFIADAGRFAHDGLLPGLDSWATLGAPERSALAQRAAGFVGLHPDYLLSKGLKIEVPEFQKALLADRHEVIGMYDGRYTLPAMGGAHDPVGDDPAMGQYAPAFIGGFETYIRDDLGIDVDDEYVVIDWINVNFPFSQRGGEDDTAGAALAATMRRNPDMWLMSIQGWFDMFGAVGSAAYGIAQRELPSDRVEQKTYWSGHMAYVGDAGLKMAADLKDFIRRASLGRPHSVAAAAKSEGDRP